MNIVQASAISLAFSAPWTASHVSTLSLFFHTQTHARTGMCKCTHALMCNEAFTDCGITRKFRGITFNCWLMKVNKSDLVQFIKGLFLTTVLHFHNALCSFGNKLQASARKPYILPGWLQNGLKAQKNK